MVCQDHGRARARTAVTETWRPDSDQDTTRRRDAPTATMPTTPIARTESRPRDLSRMSGRSGAGDARVPSPGRVRGGWVAPKLYGRCPTYKGTPNFLKIFCKKRAKHLQKIRGPTLACGSPCSLPAGIKGRPGPALGNFGATHPPLSSGSPLKTPRPTRPVALAQGKDAANRHLRRTATTGRQKGDMHRNRPAE